MHPSFWRRGVLWLVLMLAPALAWPNSFFLYRMYTPDFMMTVTAQAALDNALQERAKQRKSGAALSANRSATAGPVSFSYARDVGMSRQAGAKFGEGVAGMVNGANASPQRQQQTRANFENKDIAQEMAGRFAGSLPAYDMMTAVAVYSVIGFEILGQDTVGAQQLGAVHQDLKDSYALLPQIAQMTAPQRQRFAESLYWAAYLSAVMQATIQRNGDSAALAKLQELTRTQLKQLRIDPSRLRLTPQGLQTR
jgi:hypothetical protein